MSKMMRNSLIMIIIILLVFAIVCVAYQQFKSEPMNANNTKENILGDANTGLDNMLNEILKDEENTEAENTVKNKEENVSNVESNTSKDDETEDEEENQMTPRESKAIKLAKEEWKKEWGSLDDVSFNVSVQSDGKYGVTVYDTTTTQSIQFYIVDVDTGIVKEK